MEVWEDRKETLENKKKAILITFLVNVLILVGFYFIVVWKQPVPPMSQFGLELNLGFSDTGTDSEQATTESTSNTEAVDEAAAPGDPASQPIENVQPVSPPKPQPTPAQPSQNQPRQQPQSQVPSPVQTIEEPKPAPDRPTETKEKPTENTVNNQPAEKSAPEKVEEKKPTVDPRAIFGGGGKSGTSNQPSAGKNEGTSSQQGNEGNPQGTVDGRSILESGRGNTGDGAGYNLDLAGWDLASRPTIKDEISNRDGRITFKIKVNSSGRVVQAIPEDYNVTNEVLSYYRTVVNSLSFKRLSNNPTAEYSDGRITFIIRVD